MIVCTVSKWNTIKMFNESENITRNSTQKSKIKNQNHILKQKRKRKIQFSNVLTNSNSYIYQVFRQAREFFDQPSIKLFGGIAFAKTNERAGKSLEPESKKVEEAATVQAREIALEDYLLERAKNFFSERSVTWDVASAGRSLSNAIPDEVKESVRELVTEGRTKKKILKKLIPILGLLKLKLAGLAVLAVAAIGLIAKKALITSFIAIAIAGASFLGSVVAKLFSVGSGIAGGLKSGGGGLGSLGGGSGGLGGGLGNLLGGLNGGGGGGNGGYNNANVEEIIAYNT